MASNWYPSPALSHASSSSGAPLCRRCQTPQADSSDLEGYDYLCRCGRYSPTNSLRLENYTMAEERPRITKGAKERLVRYVHVNFKITVPTMPYNEDEEHRDSDCDVLEYTGKSRARRYRPLPPDENQSRSPSPVPSHSSRRTSRETTPGLSHDKHMPLPEHEFYYINEERHAQQQHPAEADRFHMWLQSVLLDVYPPNQVELVRRQLLSMPLYPDAIQQDVIQSLLPEGMDIVFLHLRRPQKGRQSHQFPSSHRPHF